MADEEYMSELHERRARQGDRYSMSLVIAARSKALTQELRDDGVAYAVVDAPGWYGSHTRVRRVYASLEEADAARLPSHSVLIAGHYSQGERVHRLDAERGAKVLDGIRLRYADAKEVV